MPWVIAIMMFLTVLMAAAGLGLFHAAQLLSRDLAGGATVQVIEADAVSRQDTVARLKQVLARAPEVAKVEIVPESTLLDQLRPWLGDDLASSDLPVPALIDVQLRSDAPQVLASLRSRIAPISAGVRVEPHAKFLGPLSGLMRSLAWLAAGIILLMAIATGAVVILAARGAHDSHRATIDVLHLMGATDVQIARLFQRRMALDALFGGTLGFAGAVAVILIVAQRLKSTGSDIVQSIALPGETWLLLAALPIAGVGLAMLTARMTVLTALERQL
ncbi:MAG: cell division protein [Sphingobium sp.]|nr:cell division protein [Sphingobium sp.]MDX3909270.1 cell division protein [Sphingobium sp.]